MIPNPRIWLSVACYCLAASAAGCTTTPEVSQEQVCASPEAYDGRTIWLRAEPDPSSLGLFQQSLVWCGGREAECCNTGWYYFVVPCGERRGIALVPTDIEERAPSYEEEHVLMCRGAAGGKPDCHHTADCSEEAPELERFRGKLIVEEGDGLIDSTWDELHELRVTEMR